MEAKVLLWPFRFEMSLDIHVVPSRQEMMVTMTRAVIVEVGERWN